MIVFDFLKMKKDILCIYCDFCEFVFDQFETFTDYGVPSPTDGKEGWKVTLRRMRNV